jgi:hypothetical protein
LSEKKDTKKNSMIPSHLLVVSTIQHSMVPSHLLVVSTIQHRVDIYRGSPSPCTFNPLEHQYITPGYRSYSLVHRFTRLRHHEFSSFTLITEVQVSTSNRKIYAEEKRMTTELSRKERLTMKNKMPTTMDLIS